MRPIVFLTWLGFLIVTEALFASPALSSEDNIRGPLGQSMQAVGTLKCGRKSVHATLVGNDRTIVTVGHVLPLQSPQKSSVACLFMSKSLDGSRTFRSRARLRMTGLSHMAPVATDWAVFRLDRPLPARPLGLGRLSDIDKGYQVSLMAFRDHRSASPLISKERCNVRRAEDRQIVIRHDCPTYRGLSGAPLVYQIGQRWMIAGLHARADGKGPGLEGWPRRELVREISSSARWARRAE